MTFDNRTDMASVVEGFNEIRGDSDEGGAGDILFMHFGVIGKTRMEKAKIMGVACQEDPDLPVLSVSCNDKFKDLMWIQPFGVSVMAFCPPPSECGEEPVVEGQNTGYSPDSQVCRAAKHSGMLKKSGAGFVVSLNRGSERYKNFTGSAKNEVTSQTKKYKDERATYQVDALDIICPQEAYANAGNVQKKSYKSGLEYGENNFIELEYKIKSIFRKRPKSFFQSKFKLQAKNKTT